MKEELEYRTRAKAVMSPCETYFTAVDEIHDEIEFVGRLKRELQRDEERMARVFDEHVAFGHDVTLLPLSFDQGFADHFHGVDRSFRLVQSQIDFAKRALPNARLKIEIIGLDPTKNSREDRRRTR